MDQRSNALDLSGYFPAVDLPITNTKIVEQSRFDPILPEWQCFMGPMVYTPTCTGGFSALHNAQNAPRYVTSSNVDNMHFPLSNRHTSSSAK